MKTLFFIVTIWLTSLNTYSCTNPLPIDSTETEAEFNQRQYNKMITQADKYFDEKKYDKAKKLYNRAITFQPNYDNTYAKQQINRIDNIHNSIYIKRFDRSFNEGLTEFKTFIKTDRNGDIIAYSLIRVIVEQGKADVYEKRVTRYVTTYMKNNEAITEYKWSEDTNRQNLKRNE
jgi:tetratricopeptide (TPR) repeat protein